MPRRILFIKLTSLGDLIHAFPALTDACLIYKDVEFDWVVDESFKEVPFWHPAVKNVFTTSHRKWRRSLGQINTYRSVYQLIHSLRRQKYDLVIDGQGNFKSASLAYLIKGLRVGFDWHSAREKIAALAYQKGCSISRQEHAIDRLRTLLAFALDYTLPNTAPNYGINQERFIKPAFSLPNEYLVFVHNATWKTKLWPEEHWQELIKKSVGAGYTILLPWGNAVEEARAKRLAISDNVKVLPKLSLSEVGYVLSKALGCVSMDTGLCHMAAGLNIPTITIYGATDPKLIGAIGNYQTHFTSSLGCFPCSKKECPIQKDASTPPCLASQIPHQVFFALQNILQVQRAKEF